MSSNPWLPVLLQVAVWLAVLIAAPDLSLSFLTLAFEVLAAICAATAPIVLWKTLRWAGRVRQGRWLLRHGVPVQTRITAAERWGHPVPTIDDIVLVELQLETLSEAPPRTLPIREWIDVEWCPEVGDQVWLLVDPEHPDRYCLAPFGRTYSRVDPSISD